MKLKDNILANIEKLPENLQVEILHYSEYLLNKYAKKNEEILCQKQQKNKLLEEKYISMSSQKNDEKPHGYGSWAGDIIMSDDFDEPLEDLAEYM